MTMTVRAVAAGAMKKLSVLAAGRSPTGDQGQDALDILQALYKEFVGQGVFGKIYDTLVTGATYTAHENERCVCNRSAGVTVTLPDTITIEFPTTIGFVNGSTDYGWGNSYTATPRTPRDGSVIAITDLFSTLDLTYIYDAPNSRWTSIDSLTLDSVAPLSGRYGEGLKAILAVRWAPNFNIEPQRAVIGQANSAHSMLSHRYDRPYRAVAGQYL